MLEEARTVQGIMRLYTEPKWSDCYRGNLHGANPSFDDSLLYYAHVAQDERIEQWTPLVLQSYENSPYWDDMEKQTLCSDLLRNLALWKQYEPVDPDGVA